MRFSFLCLMACAAPVFAQPQPLSVASLLALQSKVTSVVARTRPAIVTVIVKEPRSAFDKDQDKSPSDHATPAAPSDHATPGPATPAAPVDPSAPVGAIGTGWICRSDGLILTNYHVVSGALSIHVLFSDDSEEIAARGLGVPARVVGYDAKADIALIRVARTHLPVLNLADSDTAQTGQWVIAVGTPLVESKTVTLGVLSARGRHLSEEEDGEPAPKDYLQTDALLNHGNSGGPLLDLEGRVVGMNSALLTQSDARPGVGLALAANTIRQLLPGLVAGRARHAFLGASYSRLSPNTARAFGLNGGLLVGSLAQKDDEDFGPAKSAGLRARDIIFGVDGKPVATTAQLFNVISRHAPGERLLLDIARPVFEGTQGIRKMKIPLVLGEAAPASSEGAPAPMRRVTGSGLSVGDAKNLDAAHKSRYALKGTERGAVMLGIAPTSRADEARLQEGRRIVRARRNGKWTTISSAAAWKLFESKAGAGAHLVIEVQDHNDDSEFRVLVLPAK